MNFPKTLSELNKQRATGKINKPLKNFHEICEMLNVKEGKVRQAMMKNNSPKPKIIHKSKTVNSNSWYDPIEFKAWWKTVCNDVSKT